MNHECSRAFTHKDRLNAEAWWGDDNPPVAMSDLSPDCKDIIEPITTRVLRFVEEGHGVDAVDVAEALEITLAHAMVALGSLERSGRIKTREQVGR